MVGCGKRFTWARCERHTCGEDFVLPSGKRRRNYYLCEACKLEKVKKNFPKTWGMTYKEFEKKISTPSMKILVKELRKRFEVVE